MESELYLNYISQIPGEEACHPVGDGDSTRKHEEQKETMGKGICDSSHRQELPRQDK